MSFSNTTFKPSIEDAKDPSTPSIKSAYHVSYSACNDPHFQKGINMKKKIHLK